MNQSLSSSKTPSYLEFLKSISVPIDAISMWITFSFAFCLSNASCISTNLILNLTSTKGWIDGGWFLWRRFKDLPDRKHSDSLENTHLFSALALRLHMGLLDCFCVPAGTMPFLGDQDLDRLLAPWQYRQLPASAVYMVSVDAYGNILA